MVTTEGLFECERPHHDEEALRFADLASSLRRHIDRNNRVLRPKKALPVQHEVFH